MEHLFLTYQKFFDKTQAEDFAELLSKNNIEFLLEDGSPNFDPSFSYNPLNKEYRIKIQKSDFVKADLIQTEIASQLISSADKDYYLFSFSDEELIDLIKNNDEWSKFDYLLAQKILQERGKEVNEDFLNNAKKQRIEELAKPEKSQKVLIIAGYIFALLGGLLGIFIGWHLASQKKTLPNGDTVYSYSAADRKHGNRIFILGVVFIIFWLIKRIVQ